MTDANAAKGWPRVFADGRGLAGALASVWEGCSPAGMTGGHLRDLTARFLDEAAPVLGVDLAPAAARWREAGAAWTVAADAALPVDVPEFARLRSLTAAIQQSVVGEGDAGRADAAAAAAELWGGHPVVVHGLDGDTYSLDDRGVAPLTVPRAQFDAARSRVGSSKHLLIVPEPTGDVPEPTLRTALAAGIASEPLQPGEQGPVGVLPLRGEREHDRPRVVVGELPQDVPGPRAACAAEHQRLGELGTAAAHPVVGEDVRDRRGTRVLPAAQPVAGSGDRGIGKACDVPARRRVALPGTGHPGADADLELLLTRHDQTSRGRDGGTRPHAPRAARPSIRSRLVAARGTRGGMEGRRRRPGAGGASPLRPRVAPPRGWRDQEVRRGARRARILP